MIFTPAALFRVTQEVVARDMMIVAGLGAAQAAEIFHRPMRAGAVETAHLFKEHRLNETRGSIASKLKRGTFAATFFVGCLAALEASEITQEDV
jgi:hypothetical protein